MTDAEIERQRIAGEISLILEHGSEEEKQSMARLLMALRPEDYAVVLESYGVAVGGDD